MMELPVIEIVKVEFNQVITMAQVKSIFKPRTELDFANYESNIEGIFVTLGSGEKFLLSYLLGNTDESDEYSLGGITLYPREVTHSMTKETFFVFDADDDLDSAFTMGEATVMNFTGKPITNLPGVLMREFSDLTRVKRINLPHPVTRKYMLRAATYMGGNKALEFSNFWIQTELILDLGNKEVKLPFSDFRSIHSSRLPVRMVAGESLVNIRAGYFSLESNHHREIFQLHLEGNDPIGAFSDGDNCLVFNYAKRYSEEDLAGGTKSNAFGS